jgi:hypothetical protein
VAVTIISGISAGFLEVETTSPSKQERGPTHSNLACDEGAFEIVYK